MLLQNHPSSIYTPGTQTVVTSACVTTPPQPVIPSTSTSRKFKEEPPKLEPIPADNVEDDYVEGDNFFIGGRSVRYENVGYVAGPYLMPYVYKLVCSTRNTVSARMLTFLWWAIFPIGVDTDGDITIEERVFKGWKGLCELFTRKNVYTEFITKDDLKTYKKTLMVIRSFDKISSQM